ncbi:natural cytotoxicity triggering receptor 3 ligand 1 isoform X2 [Notamacropus eugenii]|uniref:natural cytotoxicity triggering receptor 3 ligand 1 isoform X2 n=1 Tax=Notamacropus eugenii TaxID=9315 RepID=UPI003B67B09D
MEARYPVAPAMLLGVLLGLCRVQNASGFLEVRMDEKAQIVSLNENVTILCVLSGYGSQPLNIRVIGVRWFLRRSKWDKERKIFEYNGRNQTQSRPGTNISMLGLRRGDASLHLSHVQLQEEGEYRCEIIVPPNRAQGTARLDIVAQPSSILLPPEVVVEERKAYTLECTVVEFYPESIHITWMKVIPGTHSREIFEDIPTSSIRNDDGTFNATSSFILHPGLEDNGTIYQCVFTHKSLSKPLQSRTVLIVTDSLEVKMNEKIQTVFLNSNVTIPCVLSGYDSLSLDIRDIHVRWSRRRSKSDKVDKVFEFFGGQPSQFRPGANISMSGLKEGDASLHLSHIQLQEGGEYTCEVIISPRRAQGTIRLDVIAKTSLISESAIFEVPILKFSPGTWK